MVLIVIIQAGSLGDHTLQLRAVAQWRSDPGDLPGCCQETGWMGWMGMGMFHGYPAWYSYPLVNIQKTKEIHHF